MPERLGAPPESWHQDRRRYVVPVSLNDLRGPSAGVVRLSPGLDWSGDSGYDLGDDGDAALMYQTVLSEASTSEDLNRWLDSGVLRRLWPVLWLPAAVRAVWETTFPELKRPPQALAG